MKKILLSVSAVFLCTALFVSPVSKAGDKSSTTKICEAGGRQGSSSGNVSYQHTRKCYEIPVSGSITTSAGSGCSINGNNGGLISGGGSSSSNYSHQIDTKWISCCTKTLFKQDVPCDFSRDDAECAQYINSDKVIGAMNYSLPQTYLW